MGCTVNQSKSRQKVKMNFPSKLHSVLMLMLVFFSLSHGVPLLQQQRRLNKRSPFRQLTFEQAAATKGIALVGTSAAILGLYGAQALANNNFQLPILGK